MQEELFTYADNEVGSYEGRRVPRWLIFTYIFLPLFCLGVAYLYWGGAWGWLDRGYWYELQKAAKTTFPLEKQSDIQVAQENIYTQPL